MQVVALILSLALVSPSASAASCQRPKTAVPIEFSRSKYPHIFRHYRRAIRDGWPRRLVVNRRRDDLRRDKLLAGFPTKDGFDRDEYPPSVGRGRGGRKLTRGRHPRGWKASVAYVESGENRSHGASMGNQLRPYCNGTKWRYAWDD